MADKEYAIWRAIGILTQRVRDLEQPTAAPEPPLCACGHSKREHEVFGVCQGSECGCMGYEKPEPPKSWPVEYGAIGAAIDKLDKEGHLEKPEASQPLPAAVEAAVRDILFSLPVRTFISPSNGNAYLELTVIRDAAKAICQRLASLWPKAGQVPSVHSPLPWRLEEDVMGCKNVVDVNGDEVFSTPGLNNEAVDKGNVELILAVVNSRAVKPSSVTAEKLTHESPEIKALKTKIMGTSYWWNHNYDELLDAVLAFPSLGQRLTRDDPRVKAIKELYLKEDDDCAFDNMIDRLLALQGPMTVSKEQWAKLVSRLESRHVILQPAIVFRQWLKAEFGAEVAG